MAAELTGRICYGLEIDPGYVDVIVADGNSSPGKPPRSKGTVARSIRSRPSSQQLTETGIQAETLGPQDECGNVSSSEEKSMSRPVCTDQRATAHGEDARRLRAQTEGIARMVGLRSPKTLRKHFREVTLGEIEAVAQVAQTHYQMGR